MGNDNYNCSPHAALLVVRDRDGGAELWRGELPGVAGGWSLREAVRCALYLLGLRDWYLRRYELLPGPVELALAGRAHARTARPGHVTIVCPAQLALLRSDGCHWAVDRSTVRDLLVELHVAHR